MKIGILGTGAMGCLFGTMLYEAGHEVWLINPNHLPVNTINSSGIIVERDGKERIIKGIKATTLVEEVGEVQIVIVCVKAGSTFEAINGAKSLIGNKTIVITLQNGIGNVETICRIVNEEKIIAGITGQGSTLIKPGHIRHAGSGDTTIGDLISSSNPKSKTIANLFNMAGIHTKVTDNVEGLIWGKLLVNVGINPLTALTGFKNGQLLDYKETEELMEMAIKEAYIVAKRKGIKLEITDPVAYTKKICEITKNNKSSMLQDVLNNKMTEIDYINGAVVKEGKQFFIETPINKVLANLVRLKHKLNP